MADITVTEELVPRYSVDEYGCLSLQVATSITFADGRTMEDLWRCVITPDDTIADMNIPLDPIPQALIDAVAAARYPAAVARFEARKAEGALDPVAEEALDPVAEGALNPLPEETP